MGRFFISCKIAKQNTLAIESQGVLLYNIL